tara:strand:- start:4750 stop:5211 length:462 start_codon:yes stop_codon:yes gene_type:complete
MPNVPKEWMANAVKESSPFKDEIVAAGKYDFKVSTAWEDVAKSGNPPKKCIALSIDIVVGMSTKRIYDRLWFTEAAAFKIHGFCKAAGLMSIINNGGVLSATDCLNVKGVAEVAVQDATDKYPESNIIAKYFPKGGPTSITPPSPADDTDLPF